uniref:S phase cyclin A-associated protein in the endoplasmic reticulum-like n=2 Tax=Hirondellea gigas TaxID=1518452 RepID=A0A6A7FT43_9CRUS
MFATLDWSEEVCDSSSSRGVLESARLREPGRVLQIHEKLSSPARKLPLHEKLRLHKERLAKAEMLRQALIKTKTEKLKELFRKIEEVSVDKERLLDEKRQLLERKMERAEEKRRQHLQCIVAKAHDEDNKGREIAFINGLEAQNKLHDLIQQHQIHSSRLADMAEERCRRQEEKAAKEAAALERRRALEAERQARLLQLCEKRRERCERIDRQQAERREELLEQAREKARDRQERLNALVQAQQAKECELVRRIQQKQQESARRHEENIEQIKRRALESSILRCSRGCDDAPKIGRYERRKLCTLCHCLLNSEVYLLSHLRGSRHQDALRELLDAPHVSSEDTATYNLRHIVDAPDNFEDPQVTRDKERQKALKKRCRKIRSRMAGRARDYDGGYKAASAPQTQNSRRTARALHNISKLHSSQGTGPWSATEVAALDKSLLELLRILDKKDANEQAVFCALNGYENIIDLLQSLLLSSASSSAAEAVRNTKKKKSAKPINENDDKCDNNNKENTSRNESQKNIQNNSKRKNSKKSQQRLQSSENDTDELLSLVDSEASIASSNNTTPRCYVIPSKSAGLCSRVLFYSLAGNTKNSLHLLYSNLASVLVDWLILRLRDMTVEISSSSTAASGAPVHSPSVFTRLPSDPAVTHTLEVLAEVLCVVSEADLSTNNNELKEKSDTAGLRLQDLVSYCVCVGVADRVSWYLSHVQGPAPLDADPAVSELILAAMSLLSAMANTLLTRRSNNNSKEDPTQLLGTLQVTEACGVVSLLYGLLLHAGGRSSYLSPTSTFTSSPTPPALANSSNASSATTTHSSNTSSSATSSATATPSPVHLQLEQVSSSVTVHSIDSSSGAEYTGAGVSSSCNTSQPPKLLPAIDAITIAATTLLRNLAMLNLGVFQGVLGSEGISLELRHVASFLLWYCSYWPSEPILHNIIALVGFLTVNNNENQCVVQTGETPTVLQQLCGLPWQYFSEPRLTAVLFPTLLACCTGSPHNTAILHTEMSAQVLEDYLRDEAESSSSPLLAILRQTKHQE